MKDITIEEAVKILKDIPFYEQVENHDVDGPRRILRTNNRLKQARDIVLKELNGKNGTINALKIALKERTDERDKKDEIIDKKDKIIDAMLEEITDCEFEMQCSECTYECEKDYDQLYECNKQYFERKVENGGR